MKLFVRVFDLLEIVPHFLIEVISIFKLQLNMDAGDQQIQERNT